MLVVLYVARDATRKEGREEVKYYYIAQGNNVNHLLTANVVPVSVFDAILWTLTLSEVVGHEGRNTLAKHKLVTTQHSATTQYNTVQHNTV